MTDERNEGGAHAAARRGVAQGLGAYLIWGFMPVFFKLLAAVPALEIVAHRVVWSAVLLVALLALRGRLAELIAALRTPRTLGFVAATALLISVNWLTYIWSINNHHVLAGSLGYFLNPLLSILLGYLFLKERLSGPQKLAVALAASGVAVLASGALATLWISLTLAATFGVYGLVKKVAGIGPLIGLTCETLILLPLALAYAGWTVETGTGAFGTNGFGATELLLVGGGVITAVPLLLFASAARRLTLATMGLLQYLAPSIQFVLGVFVYAEPLTRAHIVCFALIWTGLAIYTADAARGARRLRADSAAASERFGEA